MGAEKLYTALTRVPSGSPLSYLVAIAFVAIAVGLRLTFPYYLSGMPFSLLYLAVIATTFFCGARAGTFAVVLATAIGWYLFISPRTPFAIQSVVDVSRLVGFVIVGVIQMVVVAVMREAILKLRDVNAALERAEAEAVQANRAKSDFLSRMSHELRTPLNAIIGFAQLLQIDRKRSLSAEQQESVHHIYSSGQHLLGLVNEVLDLASVEAGTLKLSIERVDTRKALESVLETMAVVATKAEVTLVLQIDAGVADLRADARRVRQVLLNLVANAVKFNRKGGSVTLRAAMSGDRVRLSVVDTGIGISEQQAQGLFQPFHRLGAEYTAVEGAGIGLAISKRLTEAMSGGIGFTSAPGEGTTFWIELPAEAVGTSANIQPAAARVPPVAPQSGYSLLYIEDNPVSLRLVEHLVRMLPDVTMLSTPRPQLGLDLAAAHRPRVIVVDINLPEMSGFEVLRRLKEMPETRDIPVLALSAAAMPNEIKRGLDAGFFAYMTKPLDVSEFTASVEAALNVMPKPRSGTSD